MGSLIEYETTDAFGNTIVSVPSRGNGFLNEIDAKYKPAEAAVSVPSRGNGFLNKATSNSKANKAVKGFRPLAGQWVP